MIDANYLLEAFAGFDPVRVARMSPERLLAKHWDKLGAIRFRKKVSAIVDCAKVLLRIEHDSGSSDKYLNGFGIPRRTLSEDDLVEFWRGFDRLLADCVSRGNPSTDSGTIRPLIPIQSVH